MATYVITHEVDDVEQWLSSPKREEVFGPIGITVRPFHDPAGSNKVALIAEIPDMDAFQEFMQSDADFVQNSRAYVRAVCIAEINEQPFAGKAFVRERAAIGCVESEVTGHRRRWQSFFNDRGGQRWGGANQHRYEKRKSVP